ncbi:MAG: hypothetical protein LIO93_02535 [Bacteroidales bacterium]|nr:hypothetical protein [Bacteroidales bacterium]
MNYSAYGGNGTSYPGIQIFDQIDLQLRPNNMVENRSIFWVAEIIYGAGVILRNSYTTTVPLTSNNNWGGTYAGIDDASGDANWKILAPTTTLSNSFYSIAWYNSNVLAGGIPESRMYRWMETVRESTEITRTVYTLTFTMGGGIVNTQTVTDETAKNAIVYIKIEQSTYVE